MKHLKALAPNVQAELLEEALNLANFYGNSDNWQNFCQGYEEIEGSNPISAEDKGRAARLFLKKVQAALQAKRETQQAAKQQVELAA